jgi:hypothetical protein
VKLAADGPLKGILGYRFFCGILAYFERLEWKIVFFGRFIDCYNL